MRAVILANGEFPTKQDLLDELREAEFLVVCDGAIRHLAKLGIEPSAIVGDLDSISQELKENYQDRIIHIAEQESNDLSKAFFYALNQGADEFVILGATGKREDHTLANIFLLEKFFAYCHKIEMKSDFGVFKIFQTPISFATKIGEQISLFSLNQNIPIASKGLKYPLKDLCLSSLYMGTLNESVSEEVTLISEKDLLIIVYQTMD